MYAHPMTEELRGTPQYPEIDEEYVGDIRLLATMHDVGKIGTYPNPMAREIALRHHENGPTLQAPIRSRPR